MATIPTVLHGCKGHRTQEGRSIKNNYHSASRSPGQRVEVFCQRGGMAAAVLMYRLPARRERIWNQASWEFWSACLLPHRHSRTAAKTELNYSWVVGSSITPGSENFAIIMDSETLYLTSHQYGFWWLCNCFCFDVKL